MLTNKRQIFLFHIVPRKGKSMLTYKLVDTECYISWSGSLKLSFESRLSMNYVWYKLYRIIFYAIQYGPYYMG